MDDFSFSEPIGGRWDDMCQRLQPLLGDVAGQLGPNWHRTLEDLFTPADLDVAQAVLRGPGTACSWFLIRFTAEGEVLDEGGDGLACAASFTEAVAALLEACEARRVLPTAVEYDAVGSTLRLIVRGEVLATVLPMNARLVDATLRKRALSTVTKLRTALDADDELLKRVRRWPGLSGVAHPQGLAEKRRLPQYGTRHHPLPREWLVSARELCRACGRADPATALVEAVAVAALGAHSWNHLARLGDRSAALLQPWYVKWGDHVYSDPHAPYSDAIDAFADTMVRLTKEYAARWQGVSVEGGHSFPSAMPIYWFREQARSSSDLWISQKDPTDVAVYPVLRVEPPKPDRVTRVNRAFEGEAADVVRLFGTGLPRDVKSRMLDDLAGQMLIVQEAGWRFTRTGDPMHVDTTIWAYRLDENGNCVETAAVPAYKGLLLSHRRTGAHILSADYGGRHPVAIVRGLSPSAVAQVRACLPDTSGRRMDFDEGGLSERDRRAFDTLLAGKVPI